LIKLDIKIVFNSKTAATFNSFLPVTDLYSKYPNFLHDTRNMKKTSYQNEKLSDLWNEVNHVILNGSLKENG